MSFVEKNKAWLLPLLVVGAAAVIYMDFHTSAPAAALPAAPALPAQAGPANGPATTPAPPPSVPSPAMGGGPGAIWDDLKALAHPPAAILEENALRQRCRSNLDALLDVRFPTGLPRPGAVREASSERSAPPPGPGAAPARPAPPMPELSFILSGPGGLRAWFKGRPYREGDEIAGGGFRVGSIRRNRVGLVDAAGKTVIQYTDSHRPVAGSRPTVEAP